MVPLVQPLAALLACFSQLHLGTLLDSSQPTWANRSQLFLQSCSPAANFATLSTVTNKSWCLTYRVWQEWVNIYMPLAKSHNPSWNVTVLIGLTFVLIFFLFFKPNCSLKEKSQVMRIKEREISEPLHEQTQQRVLILGSYYFLLSLFVYVAAPQQHCKQQQRL